MPVNLRLQITFITNTGRNETRPPTIQIRPLGVEIGQYPAPGAVLIRAMIPVLDGSFLLFEWRKAEQPTVSRNTRNRAIGISYQGPR